MTGMGVAALALGACTPQADLVQLNNNQFALRGMIASDRQRLSSLERRIRRLQDEIVEIKHGGKLGSGAGGDQAAQISERLSKLESKVGALEAAVESAPASAAGEALAPGLAAGVVAAPAERKPEWPERLDEAIAAAKGSSASGAKLYRQGLEAMKEGKYRVAVLRFSKLQHKYPKSPFAEPAKYFAANALYELGNYKESILQFNDLVLRYPKGRFASVALLRQAEAFLKINDEIDARLTLKKLIADHGDTPEATAANDMMRNLVSN